MSGPVLKRLPRPSGEPRRYRVQIGEGRSSRVLGYLEELTEGRWQTVNTFRPKQQRVVQPYPSCKLAIRALVQADEAADPGRRAA